MLIGIPYKRHGSMRHVMRTGSLVSYVDCATWITTLGKVVGMSEKLQANFLIVCLFYHIIRPIIVA